MVGMENAFTALKESDTGGSDMVTKYMLFSQYFDEGLKYYMEAYCVICFSKDLDMRMEQISGLGTRNRSKGYTLAFQPKYIVYFGPYNVLTEEGNC